MISKMRRRKLFAGMAELGAADLALIIDDRPPKARLPSADYIAYRAKIIEKVRTGEMRPHDAEKIAKDEFDDPFQNVPDHIGSPGPMISVFSPEMAAIWITTSNLKATHRHFEPSYKGRSVWVKNDMWYPPRSPHSREVNFHSRRGHDLVELTATNVCSPLKFITFEGQERNFPAMEDWFGALRQPLTLGKIKASGFATWDGRLRQDIPSRFWHDAEFATEKEQTVLKINGARSYSKVLFEASDLLKIAPELPHLKWKADPGKLPPLARRVLNSLKNASPAGLPYAKPIGRIHEQLLESLEEEDDRKRWATPGSFSRYLREKKKQFCE